MALYALKHRDVAEIDRVFERLVRFVTRLALAIGEPAKIDGMLERRRLRPWRRSRRVRQNRMADIAIVSYDFSVLTVVLAVVTAETA